MKIYISGPITGTRYYMERFRKAEEKLTAAGHTVYNPAKSEFLYAGGNQTRRIHEGGYDAP